MTVTRNICPSSAINKSGRSSTSEVEDMLQKHWGTTKVVEVNRGEDKGKGIGISIVGGKVTEKLSYVLHKLL